MAFIRPLVHGSSMITAFVLVMMAVMLQASGSSAGGIIQTDPRAAAGAAAAPTLGRLVFGGKPRSVRVVWQTGIRTATPRVHFGTKPGQYDWVEFATAETADPCGLAESGLVNTALLRGLQPDTTYYYIYGTKGALSQEASFTTPPDGPTAAAAAPATRDDPVVRLLVAAELGVSSEGAGGAELVAAPSSAESTLIQASFLATGQITPAPCSAASRMQLQALLDAQPQHGLLLLGLAAGRGGRWPGMLQELEPLATRVPLAALPGDAEFAGSECGVPFERLLRMPHMQAQEHGGYSFTAGPVHVVMLSTEHSLARDSAQFRFVQADLAALDRSATPWVVVGMHRGVYDAAGDTEVAGQLSASLEQLFVEHGVDLVLSSRSRIFQQSCPVVQGNCVGFAADGSALGPVHVSMGSSGAAISLLEAQAQAPSWMVAGSFDHSLGQLTASRRRLSLQVVSPLSGAVISSVLLTKPSGWTPAAWASTAARAQSLAADALQSAGAGGGDQHWVQQSGLAKLLQQDLLAAAAHATPAMQSRLAGPGSLLHDTVKTATGPGSVPTAANTWLITMQLMQMVLDFMAPLAPPPPLAPPSPSLELQEPDAPRPPAEKAPAATQPLPGPLPGQDASPDVDAPPLPGPLVPPQRDDATLGPPLSSAREQLLIIVINPPSTPTPAPSPAGPQPEKSAVAPPVTAPAPAGAEQPPSDAQPPQHIPPWRQGGPAPQRGTRQPAHRRLVPSEDSKRFSFGSGSNQEQHALHRQPRDDRFSAGTGAARTRHSRHNTLVDSGVPVVQQQEEHEQVAESEELEEMVAEEQQQAVDAATKARTLWVRGGWAQADATVEKRVAAQLPPLPANLALIRADGTAVPQATVDGFVRAWTQLTGLARGDVAPLLQARAGWRGGWLAGPSAQPPLAQ